jgi:hypothetical protein
MTDYRVVQTVTKVLTDEGIEGYYVGGHFHGDQDGLIPGDQALITQFLSPLLAGQDRSTGRRSGGNCGRRRSPKTSAASSIWPCGIWPAGSPGCRYTNCSAAPGTG